MRVSNQVARNHYLLEGIGQQWSVRQLERNIKSLSYQHILSSQGQSAIDKNKTEDIECLDFIKDPYVLEFLQLPETTTLKESKLKMGKGFSFIARQMRISTETSHFYMDLALYNFPSNVLLLST